MTNFGLISKRNLISRTRLSQDGLLKTKMEVGKLFTDLADRRKLLRVLEIISGEKLGKTNSGRYIAQYHFFKCTKNKDRRFIKCSKDKVDGEVIYKISWPSLGLLLSAKIL